MPTGATANGELGSEDPYRIALDNPGWQAHISLRDTRRQNGRVAEESRIDRDEKSWIHYWIDESQVFHIACGPTNLSEAIDIFVHWFESDSLPSPSLTSLAQADKKLTFFRTQPAPEPLSTSPYAGPGNQIPLDTAVRRK